MKSVWGHEMNELKYTYEKEYEEKPVEKIQMTKEEFDKYIKELEIKNVKHEDNWQQVKVEE